MRRKLLQRRCRPDEVCNTLDRMTALGYLDDEAFARQLVARRSGTRGASLIAQELAAKGVPRALAKQALLTLDHGQEVAAAARLASRDARGGGERTAARLQRKGFSRQVIGEALGAVAEYDGDF